MIERANIGQINEAGALIEPVREELDILERALTPGAVERNGFPEEAFTRFAKAVGELIAVGLSLQSVLDSKDQKNHPSGPESTADRVRTPKIVQGHLHSSGRPVPPPYVSSE